MHLHVVLLAMLVTIRHFTTARGVRDALSRQSAWERSGLFEGDIKLTRNQIRNGIINPGSHWPNRTVPYVIDQGFTEAQRALLLQAVAEYHAKTCILLRDYNPETDKDYVYIKGEPSGCWSYVGRIGGRQDVNIAKSDPGTGCMTLGTIEHELLHALGFFHQQSATERDEYVKINWANIQRGTEGNFNKYDASSITSYCVKYDYGSIMHYGAYAFSKNGKKTIETLDKNATIGQRGGFSRRDIEKLSKMYGCVSL